MPVPEPTFEIARLGAAVPLYVPRWGNNAQTLHTMWPWLGRQLRDFFRDRGFDVIHVHAPYNPPFPAWAIGNAPDDAVVVATFHSVFPQTIGMDILAEWTRPWIERLDGRICVSEACIGSLAPYYPYAYDVIPNGIDADHFSPDAEPVARGQRRGRDDRLRRPVRPPKRPRDDDRGAPHPPGRARRRPPGRRRRRPAAGEVRAPDPRGAAPPRATSPDA